MIIFENASGSTGISNQLMPPIAPVGIRRNIKIGDNTKQRNVRGLRELDLLYMLLKKVLYVPNL
jgi:hypothetical protein